MTIHIRPAGTMDSRAMSELINEIIKEGGTTAYVDPFGPAHFAERMKEEGSAWHVAETDAGELVGVQWFSPHPDVPETSASIATYVRIGATGLGIGSKLFEATRQAALERDLESLDAVIRADNDGGRAYYQSRGFELIKWLKDMPLADGTRVDKVWTRCNLL